MSFLRTKIATDFRKPSTWWQRLISIDSANPSYRGKYHLVDSWLIEFDESGNPLREIGLDDQGAVVFAGPSERDYGFWLDQKLAYPDFTGDPVSLEYFEQMWAASGVAAP
jgi:hypothetical protein